MNTLTAKTAADRDVESEFRLIAAINRAAASDEFHAGIIAGYELTGRTAQAAKFTAAVEAQRALAADAGFRSAA